MRDCKPTQQRQVRILKIVHTVRAETAFPSRKKIHRKTVDFVIYILFRLIHGFFLQRFPFTAMCHSFLHKIFRFYRGFFGHTTGLKNLLFCRSSLFCLTAYLSFCFLSSVFFSTYSNMPASIPSNTSPTASYAFCSIPYGSGTSLPPNKSRHSTRAFL